MTYNGILLIDKPQDLTSHDVVYKVRKTLNTKSVGHAGTLDPMATGLLVLLVGEATKISDYVLSGDKAYECEILLGKTTDTLDITGEVLSEDSKPLTMDTVLGKCQELKGDFEWEIPMYSAKKVAGKKLYDYARNGEKIAQIPKKRMLFEEVEVRSFEYPYVKVYLKCSKGSFIRSWANELGKSLGVGACLSGLRRVLSDPYHLDNGIPLGDLSKENLSNAFIPLDESLSGLPKIEVKGFDRHLVANGQLSQGLQARLSLVHRYFSNEKGLRFRIVASDGKLLALVHRAEGGRYRFSRVFRA